MSITTDKLLIVQLANWLNDRIEQIPLPCEVLIEQHKDTGEQLWMQPLAGTKIVKRYTGGSYIGSLPFAVYHQMSNPKNPAELDVPLWQLGELFEREGPSMQSVHIDFIEMTSTPALFSRDEKGVCINQAIFQITYRKDDEL